MTYHDQVRSFDLLGGQCAPLASDGIGVRVLHRCPSCQRVWLQDGKAAILDLNPEQVARFAQELAADLDHLPSPTCRMCLWKTGGGSVSIDEYDAGEGFGLCWEIPRPLVIHATSAILSMKSASLPESNPDVLTQTRKLRAVLRFAKTAPLPQSIQPLPPITNRLQAAALPPGLGQQGTSNWQWQGWIFPLLCPPLDGEAIVTLMLAHPEKEPVSSRSAFYLWQTLLEITLLGGIPENA